MGHEKKLENSPSANLSDEIQKSEFSKIRKANDIIAQEEKTSPQTLAFETEDRLEERKDECFHQAIKDSIKKKYKLEIDEVVSIQKAKDIHNSFRNSAVVPLDLDFFQIVLYQNSTRKTSSVFMCSKPECSQVFNKLYNMVNHQRTHTKDKPFTCPVSDCNCSYSQLTNLKRHMVTHKPKKGISCRLCGVRMTSILKLLSHFNNHLQTTPN